MDTSEVNGLGRQEVVWMTPEMARALIERGNPNQRAISRYTVRRYAKTMRAGQWEYATSPIDLDGAGMLVNGYHRLHAVIEANMPVLMWLRHGANASMPFDRVRARTVADRLHMAGLGGSSWPERMAIARVLVSRDRKGGPWTEMTDEEQMEFIRRHLDAINFAISIRSGKRSLGVAHVNAVYARAWYHEDHTEVQRFADIFSAGLADEPRDNTVLRLRNLVLENPRVSRVEVYWKAERALKGFCEGEVLRNLYPAPRELYPIPGEAEGD